MYVLLSGVTCALALVAAMAFLRTYVRTADRFFIFFSAAFAIFGLTQLWLGIADAPELNRPFAYVPRLVAFLLILIAILDKNRLARS